MLLIDKKPNQFRQGHLINWVPTDDFTQCEQSTRYIFSSFPKLEDAVTRRASSELIGDVFTVSHGRLAIHNVFISRVIDNKVCINPFAITTAIRTVLDLAAADVGASTCYMAALSDKAIWDSLQRSITQYAAASKVTTWQWSV